LEIYSGNSYPIVILAEQPKEPISL
jgi:hypothetical protein